MARAQVGDFLLEAPLGRGGMGEVWRAVHAPSRTPVAVKLLKARLAEDPFYLAAFRNEVRAVAALDHPHIVRVYDHGSLEADQPRLGGGIQAGSPWLAMELLDGHPLGRLAGMVDWPEVLLLLRGLLDALAHAHARGLVHRDLKPGNVMLSGDRVVLLDFGLAHALDRSLDPEEVGTVIGTAAYMAPEQFRGRDPEYGPWTDLYALGGLAWALLCGSPPYGVGGSASELGDQHLHAELPPFEPRTRVPPGLEDWLARLLRKDPRERFRRAADAAWALHQLPAVGSAPAQVVGQVAAHTFSWNGLDDDQTVRSETFGAPEDGMVRPPHVLRPPLPPDWRTPPRPRPAGPPVGTGLGLFGIRELPLIGRTEQRDVLWSSLRAADRGRVQVVLLQGPAGCGKSRLARWLARRGHELGAVECIEVFHSVERGPQDGLGAAMARHLRVGGLPRDQARVHLTRRVRSEGGTEDTLRQLMRVVAPTPRTALSRLLGRDQAFSSATERYGVIARRLLQEARWRPLLLRMDDVQWGADALAFALHLVHQAPEGGAPILLLLTAREMPPETVEHRLLDRLLREARGRRVEVGPLPPGWRPALLEELVPLEPELRARVEARTQGNPLFMVQLLESWVAQQALEAGPEGFRLRAEVEDRLPRDLAQVWRQRVDRTLRRRSRSERHALELAALLGTDVEQAEWQAAAREARVHASAELVEDLLQAGLAEPHPDGPHAGWRFVHALLQDALVQEAAEAGREERWRLAIVAMLEARLGEQPRVALRLGSQLLALGEDEEALDPLTEGAWTAVRDSEYLLAEQVLAEREACIERLELPPDDPRPCEGWIMQARVARRRNQRSAAVRYTRLAIDTARAQAWPALLCQALREEARLAWSRGRLLAAREALQGAVEQARLAGGPVALAWSQRDLGIVQVARGASAEPLLRAASEGFAETGEIFGRASCHLALGIELLRGGRIEAGEAELSTAEQLLHEARRVQEPAHALVALGDVARWRGEHLLAEQRYHEALERFQEIGAPGSEEARLHLAAARLAQRRPRDAREDLEALRLDALEGEARGLLGPLYAHLAWAALLEDQADTATRHLELAREEVERCREPTAELAEVAETCAALAAAARHAGVVTAARGLARWCWTSLGQHHRAHRIG